MLIYLPLLFVPMFEVPKCEAPVGWLYLSENDFCRVIYGHDKISML